MINLNDPLERLRAANPVLLTDVTVSPPDPALFRRITAERRRPRRRARPLVPVLVGLSLVGGATSWALLRGVSVPESVACYERADLGAAIEVAGVHAQGPVAACAELWRRGVFGDGPVPALVECVLDTGVVGVFPSTVGDDVCRRLNLPPVPATAPPGSSTTIPGQPAADNAARVLAFRDAVGPPFLDSPCVEPAVAAALVRRELDRAGLPDWTIRGGAGLSGDGFSDQRPCATLSLRPDLREVVLVPAPRR